MRLFKIFLSQWSRRRFIEGILSVTFGFFFHTTVQPNKNEIWFRILLEIVRWFLWEMIVILLKSEKFLWLILLDRFFCLNLYFEKQKCTVFFMALSLYFLLKLLLLYRISDFMKLIAKWSSVSSDQINIPNCSTLLRFPSFPGKILTSACKVI